MSSLIDPTLCLLNETCYNCQCPSTHFGDLCEFESKLFTMLPFRKDPSPTDTFLTCLTDFCAKLFKGKSFVGESWTAMDGDENPDLGIWDQMISSIMVKPGCTLQVHKDKKQRESDKRRCEKSGNL